MRTTCPPRIRQAQQARPCRAPKIAPKRGMKKGDLSHLAIKGRDIAVRVTPKAARNRVEVTETGLRVYVTCVPEDGKANKAVIKLLAQALGVAKSRLDLIRGATSRDKVFRLR